MKKKVTQLHDSTTIMVWPDGAWTLALPSGKRIHGEADDPVAAHECALAERQRYILEQWERGAFSPARLAPKSGVFVVPLR